MSGPEYSVVCGVRLSFKQADTCFSLFCQHYPNSACLKAKLEATNMRSGEGCNVDNFSSTLMTEDSDIGSAYLEALETDLANYGLTFKLAQHDMYEKDLVGGWLLYQCDIITSLLR